MQQRDSQTNLTIARETIKDSKAMKSISLLTFAFLPGTALAVSVFHLSFYPWLSSVVTTPSSNLPLNLCITLIIKRLESLYRRSPCSSVQKGIGV